MAAVTIRNLSEETHRALKVRAAQHNRSAEAEMRAILEAAVRPEDRLRLDRAGIDAMDALGIQHDQRVQVREVLDHDRLRDRTEPVELFGASSYILAAEEPSEGSEPETLQPIIVAEMETAIPALSVGEAVMQMELAGAPVLVFRNEGKNGLNVVYRRDDGNIGWIDPQIAT